MGTQSEIVLEAGSILPQSDWWWDGELDLISDDDIDLRSYFDAPVRFLIGKADISPGAPVPLLAMTDAFSFAIEGGHKYGRGHARGCAIHPMGEYEFEFGDETSRISWLASEKPYGDNRYLGEFLCQTNTLLRKISLFNEQVFEQLKLQYPELARNPAFLELERDSREATTKFLP